VDVTAGLKAGGPLIINSDLAPAELRKLLKPGDYKLHTVNATKIATEAVGRPITNTAMVGALVKVTSIIGFENVKAELISMFGNRFKKAVVEGNVKALERAYEEVVSE
jgi:pyruvate ferredoxin oxidoreductase gamma subunit